MLASFYSNPKDLSNYSEFYSGLLATKN